MKESKLIGFDKAALKKQIMANAVANMNLGLVAYAKEEVKRIGDRIQTYHSANHMDRTGNLLNSLCWGVTYEGKTVENGFYRAPRTNIRFNRWKQLRGMGTGEEFGSRLHEWTSPQGEEVNGRQLAEDFLNAYKGKPNGWTVFFAILAPYWGYWESGFTLRSGGGSSGIPRSSRFVQFQVMTHVYDDVKSAIPSSKMHIDVYIPTYSYKSRSAKGKKYKNKPFTKKIKWD